MKECTFMKIVKKKGTLKIVQDCGICLNCLMNLHEEKIQKLVEKRRNKND